MIFRKATTKALTGRFGAESDLLETLPEDFNSTLYRIPLKKILPPFVSPARKRRLAKIATLTSARVFEGFAWHNACLPLSPDNWKAAFNIFRPDYLLVEYCLQDYARAWPYICLDNEKYARLLRQFTKAARKGNVPSIYWHTARAEQAEPFVNVLASFDIVAGADQKTVDFLRKKGIEARLLPWGFSAEQFNPLVYPGMRAAELPLIYDGIAKMMRFPRIAAILEKMLDANLEIFDSALLTPPYNLDRYANRKLASRVIGHLPQTMTQLLYKQAGAYLVIEQPEGLSPGMICSAIEAAASRLPVLLIGNSEQQLPYARSFRSAEDALEYWKELSSHGILREREAHLAWRETHKNHTFAKRMQDIHQWLGIPGNPFPEEEATIIAPSMRPNNFNHLVNAFNKQSWPRKELLYIYNGSPAQKPKQAAEKNIRIIDAQREQTTGFAMEVGIQAGKGEVFFKWDDDDLYGSEYIADRMIHFREFAIDSISCGQAWWTFGENQKARKNSQRGIGGENTAFALGTAKFDLAVFLGPTFAMRKDFARKIGFTSAAHAYADVSFTHKGMFFTPASIHIQTDSLNVAIKRNVPKDHTWSASNREIGQWLEGKSIDLESIFI